MEYGVSALGRSGTRRFFDVVLMEDVFNII